MSTKLAAIISALSLPFAAHAQTSPAELGTAAVDKAVALIKAGNIAEAMAPLDEAITYFQKANAGEKRLIFCGMSGAETILYMGLGITAKRDAVALGPDWCDALFFKGYVLIDQGKLAEGIPYLEQALSKAPYHAHYLNELGYAYQAQKEWTKSLDAYKRAQGAAELGEKDDANAQKGRALRGMGFVYIELGKWNDAEKAYRDALNLDPNDEKAKGELDYIRTEKSKHS